MTNKKNSTTQTVEVNTNLFLKIIYPEILYEVQDELTKRGIYFIDLNNGQIIKGNINIDTLGLISKKSFKKTKKAKGNTAHFLIPGDSQKVFDVEATINIYQTSNENDPTIFTVQIVNEKDLDFWYQIFVEIGQKYLYQLPTEEIKSTVIFHLVPLTLPSPKDPKSAIQAMLGNIQNYSAITKSGFDSLPGYAYPGSDFDEYDEELDP